MIKPLSRHAVPQRLRQGFVELPHVAHLAAMLECKPALVEEGQELPHQEISSLQ
jgi:hypothetical protein